MPRTSCKVLISGYVGSDPELRYTPSGTAVTNFSIAINHAKDKPPTWFRVAAWGEELGTLLADSVVKGMYLQVEGNLHARPWDDDAGASHISLEVNMSSFTVPEPDVEEQEAEPERAPALKKVVPAPKAVASKRAPAPLNPKIAAFRKAAAAKAARLAAAGEVSTSADNDIHF